MNKYTNIHSFDDVNTLNNTVKYGTKTNKITTPGRLFLLLCLHVKISVCTRVTIALIFTNKAL